MDNDTPSPVPNRGQYVPGVYNYCDAWCQRCRFQDRCQVFSTRSRMEAALAYGGDGHAAFGEDHADDRATPQPWRATFEDPGEPTPAQTAAFQARADQIDALTDADPMVIQARAYATDTEEALLGLRLNVAGDPILSTALDTISWHDFLLFVKMSRAVSSQLDNDNEDDPVQSDANGTAKLVRLLIRESRDAWEVLAQVGSSESDELARGMIARLEALDALVDVRFPRAMDFVRPGFDVEPQE